jgi:two-component system chemotaxis response regulator CheB
LLVEILNSSPDLHVIGEAKDGIEAVEMTQRLRPHVVTMDIHMPRMDGLAATKEIMITSPTPIVIVSGSTAVQDVAFAMNALRMGAVSVLEKPRGPADPEFAEAARRIVRTVKAMAGIKLVRHWRTQPKVSLPSREVSRERGGTKIIAIATSTGGPPALESILSQLPGNFPVPILVVQHIIPGFMPGLVSWLNTVSVLHAKVAEAGEPVKARTVYFGPDDHHLGVSPEGTIVLSKEPPIGGFRPSGTFLFESVARAFGSSCVALMLTGMGEDGVAGLRAIRQVRGRILVQDEQSSAVFGMPGAAIAAGLGDQVLPLDAIASQLVELV